MQWTQSLYTDIITYYVLTYSTTAEKEMNSKAYWTTTSQSTHTHKLHSSKHILQQPTSYDMLRTSMLLMTFLKLDSTPIPETEKQKSSEKNL